MAEPIVPWEHLAQAAATKHKQPALLVDLRRCTGCHACSVACKVEHNVPLGSFRMRVRWLPRPDRPGISFLPVFNAESCDFGAARGAVGLDPACVSACPTAALKFGDLENTSSAVSRETKQHRAKPLASNAKTKTGVHYIGLEPWHASKINAGAALSKDDEDITYEQ